MMDGLSLASHDVLYIVDFSPHVGCNTVAVREVQKSTPFNVYYTCFHAEQKEFAYAEARLQNLLGREWLEKTLEHPTLKPEASPGPLPDEIICKIPGAEVAMGRLDKLKLRVTQLVDGEVRIVEQHMLPFRTLGGLYQQEALALQKVHMEKHQNLLSFLASNAPPADPAPPGDPDWTHSLQLAHHA
jgi:hypothetical protein